MGVCECYLDDFVVCSEARFLCWGVIVHSPDELARSGLLTVQVEAIALLTLLQTTQTRPEPGLFILKHSTDIQFMKFNVYNGFLHATINGNTLNRHHFCVLVEFVT